MHGIVHRSIKEHINENVAGVEWEKTVERAELEPKLYLPVSQYPAEEATALLAALADQTDRPEPAVQREFGEFLGPELLDTFEAHVRDDWATRELLLSIESILERVADQNDETEPPEVTCSPDGDDAVVLTYRSDLQLCPLAKGIVLGIAGHYEETVELTETACMHEGDDRCELSVAIE